MTREELEVVGKDGFWFVEKDGERVSPFSTDKCDAYRWIDMHCDEPTEENWD